MPTLASVTVGAVGPVTVGVPVPESETIANDSCVAAAKSVALLPSTWSAFSPVATPVALVVKGAPVWSPPTSIRPASLPTVTNSNARPPLRLFERMQGSLPGFERQP